jgi:ATP/ADP translocase
MVGNVGLIMAGTVLVTFSNISILDDEILDNQASEQYSAVLEPIMITIIVSGCIAMMLYRYINQHFVKARELGNSFPSHKEETKTKLSVLESVRLILKSKYIGHIVILLLCYGLAINILEGPWKARVRELYPNTIDYINFMGKFNIWMGVSCVIVALIGSNVLRKFSWRAAALTTPCIISCTGIIFFVFVIYANDIGYLGGFSPIYLAVVIGAIQNILSKSTKYSLFDSTKEMTYIPLSLELRTKGKAAVEVIGLKFGKSLGAFSQSFIFILMPTASFDSVTMYLMVIFILIIILWIWDIRKLDQEYNKIKGDKE